MHRGSGRTHPPSQQRRTRSFGNSAPLATRLFNVCHANPSTQTTKEPRSNCRWCRLGVKKATRMSHSVRAQVDRNTSKSAQRTTLHERPTNSSSSVSKSTTPKANRPSVARYNPGMAGRVIQSPFPSGKLHFPSFRTGSSLSALCAACNQTDSVEHRRKQEKHAPKIYLSSAFSSAAQGNPC